jgi:carboxypeptidase family protein
MRRRVPVALWLFLLAARMCTAWPATPQKKSKQEDFANQLLIYGTVFTQQGFALPGAEVKVRRTSERKQRWAAYSDRRGEFAVRVPKGDQYEIAIKAKDYTTLTRTVDARSGDRQDMVFRMQPAAEGKKK